ncbi:lipoprotein [Actinoplanes sp. NPDC023714]|uniref:lipoprotein n=1 Tax=Actinoplanes sp. NPDC023714 TaxID=3154322 RepID=UPI0033EF2EFD
MAGLGLAVLMAGCASTGQEAAAPAATSASAAAAGNTAEICASGGKAARDVVVNLFGELAKVTEEPDPEAALTKIYKETFGGLGDQMRTEAGRATDPAFATVLTGIADEADKVAANPEDADTTGFETALGKLDQYCPQPGQSSGAATEPTVDGVVGAAGSGCELPVTFEVAEKWKPKAVEIAEDDPLAELASKGTLRLICEIDAKPAGHLGFLRVWTGPAKGGDLRAALKPFLTEAKTRKVTYTPAKGVDGLDVSFEQYQKLTEEWLPHRAFAVLDGESVVALDLGGIDASEHEAMLPAYELAMRTLAVK